MTERDAFQEFLRQDSGYLGLNMTDYYDDVGDTGANSLEIHNIAKEAFEQGLWYAATIGEEPDE